jgi:prepilin signal peptidase PulO-like enzyme (type II secretory pathway)
MVLALRRKVFPFGPAMLLGAAAAVAFAPLFTSWT